MIGWFIRKALGAAVWTYFRRVDAEGVEHVPPSGAVIVASNHTNALVDPLVIQYVLPRRITLTAKASLADDPYLGFLMRAVGVLRFHRRDETPARSSVEANRRAIQACRDHLARGEALCIFPEGKSHSAPGMLPFKHGVSRIALGLEVPVKVVPVGLYYERKEKFRSAVSVRFGPPIEVAGYEGTAKELTQKLRQRVEALTVEHGRLREAPLAEHVGRLLATQAAAPPELRDEAPLTEHAARLRRVALGYRQLSRDAPDELRALETRVRAHRKELGQLGVLPADLYLPIGWGRALHFALSMFEVLVVGGAIALWGWLNHLLPFLVVRTIARKLSRDRDQWASNAIYPAIAVYPFFYVLQSVLVWLLLSPLGGVAYMALLPFSGAYYVLWKDRVGAAWRRVRTFFRWRSDPALRERLAGEGRAIIEQVLALVPRMDLDLEEGASA